MSYKLVIHPKYIMEQLGKYRTEDGKTLLAVAILAFIGVERFLSEGLPTKEAIQQSRPWLWEIVKGNIKPVYC